MRIALLLVLVGCIRIVPGTPGTHVDTAISLQAKDRLGELIASELAAGRTANAFHALELAKTRPFAGFQLLYAYPKNVARGPDLRPLFEELYRPGAGDSRGFELVSAAATALAPDQQRAETVFWTEFAVLDPQPKFATVTVPNPAEIATIEQARLVFPKTAAVASYFVHGDRVWLFWLRRGSLRVIPLEASAATLRREAVALLASVKQHPEHRTDRWEPHATALYRGLLGPIADQLATVETLYICPDQFIANVPFDVLLDPAGKLLIERTRITRISSVSMHRRLLYRMVTNDEPPRILAIGNPKYPERVPDLPFAAREAAVVSEIFEEARLLTGATATEARVVDEIKRYNVLHFATHGVLLGAAVPGGSSLLVTADGDDDGFFSAREISQLDLGHLQLAVLSACETSIGDARGGSLDLASLTGAFLTAGVPTVIGTLWQVDDEATTKLMIEMYSRLHRVGPGQALREAQLGLRKTAFADPFHWAGFVVYGWGQ